MSLEEEFHEAMTDGYRRTGEATGYWANYFIRDVKQIGGLATAKKILNKGASGSSGKGLQTLIDHGRADLSLEACVVSPRFATLFTQKERNAMLHTHDPPLSVEELREILSEMDASK